MEKNAKIYVAGHTGLVGSAIVRKLRSEGFDNLISRTSKELDLRDQTDTVAFFKQEKPEHVFLAAAKVGGIVGNDSYPAEFLRDNLQIQTNVIDSAYKADVRKLLFLGSSCIYPRDSRQPMKEDYLLTGTLEETNEWYAIAKITGIKMSQAYRRQYGFNTISVMPTNLYGPGDNFNLKTSHVIPALLRKFHEAKVNNRSEVVVWGSGTPRREFLHVDDLADACLFLMQNYDDGEIINIGTGKDMTISELAELVKQITGFDGKIVYDDSKPDGTPRKQLAVERLTALGWKPQIDLVGGLTSTYRWYLENQDSARL